MEEEKKTKEIDILNILAKALKESKLMFSFCGVAAIIGIIVALNNPKEYTAQVVLAPEMSSGGLGMAESLSDMASSFGIDLGTKSSMDAIYPEIYPELFASNDFILQLLEVKVRQKKDSTERTYMAHLKHDTKVPFWKYPQIWMGELITKLIPNDDNTDDILDPFMLTRDEENMVNGIRNSISCIIDKKTSVITISITDQDPMVAAIMADTLQKRLQTYITEYRTHKARKDYEYYLMLQEESKKNYHEAQQRYTKFYDSNFDVNLQIYRTRIEELENEMQLKYNIYAQMTSQVQSAQAKIQERTPVFTIIQKPTVPNIQSSSPRALIVALYIIIGFICHTIWVNYGRTYYLKRKSINSNKED